MAANKSEAAKQQCAYISNGYDWLKREMLLADEFGISRETLYQYLCGKGNTQPGLKSLAPTGKRPHSPHGVPHKDTNTNVLIWDGPSDITSPFLSSDTGSLSETDWRRSPLTYVPQVLSRSRMK